VHGDAATKRDPPLLLLLPGLDGTGALFASFAAEVDVDHVVVAYGDTAPTSYEGLVPWLGERLPRDRRFVLLAESWSGPAAITLAAGAPAGLEALILCNTFARSPVPRWGRWLAWRRLLRLDPPDWALRRLLLGGTASHETCAAVRRALAEAGPDLLAARMRASQEIDVRAALGRITVPIVDLRGRQDRLVRGRAARDVRTEARHVTARTIDGPHLILQVRPRASWEAVRAFLA